MKAFISELLFLLSYTIGVFCFLNLRFGPLHPSDGALLGFLVHLLGIALGGHRLGGKALLIFFNTKRNFLISLIFIWIGFSALWGTTALLHFWSLRTAEFDLGIYGQSLFYFSKGEGFFQLVQPTTNANLMEDHQSFTLALFAPLFWTPWGTELLVFLQPFFLFLPGIFISYWVYTSFPGQKTHRPLWAFFFLALWFTSHPVINNILWDWHETTLSLGLLTLFTWAFFQGRFTLLFISALLSGFTKEYHFLVCGSALLLYPFFHGIKLKTNWIKGALPSLILFLLFILIQKTFAERNYSHILYSHLGSTPMEILKNALLNPSIWIQEIINNPKKTDYFIHMHSNTGFLSLFSGGYFLISIPIWMIHLLSTRASQTMEIYHYALEVWAFLSVIALFTVHFILRKTPIKFHKIFFIITTCLILIHPPKNPFHYARLYKHDAYKNFESIQKIRTTLINLKTQCSNNLIGLADIWTFSSLFREAKLYPFSQHKHLPKTKDFQSHFYSLTNLEECLFVFAEKNNIEKALFLDFSQWEVIEEITLLLSSHPHTYLLKFYKKTKP